MNEKTTSENSKPAPFLDPKAWNFPATHPIKAIGFSDQPIKETVCEILTGLGLAFQKNSITSTPSKSNKYISLTVRVSFQSSEEVEALYKKLFEHPLIVRAL